MTAKTPPRRLRPAMPDFLSRVEQHVGMPEAAPTAEAVETTPPPAQTPTEQPSPKTVSPAMEWSPLQDLATAWSLDPATAVQISVETGERATYYIYKGTADAIKQLAHRSEDIRPQWSRSSWANVLLADGVLRLTRIGQQLDPNSSDPLQTLVTSLGEWVRKHPGQAPTLGSALLGFLQERLPLVREKSE